MAMWALVAIVAIAVTLDCLDGNRHRVEKSLELRTLWMERASEPANSNASEPATEAFVRLLQTGVYDIEGEDLVQKVIEKDTVVHVLDDVQSYENVRCQVILKGCVPSTIVWIPRAVVTSHVEPTKICKTVLRPPSADQVSIGAVFLTRETISWSESFGRYDIKRHLAAAARIKITGFNQGLSQPRLKIREVGADCAAADADMVSPFTIASALTALVLAEDPCEDPSVSIADIELEQVFRVADAGNKDRVEREDGTVDIKEGAKVRVVHVEPPPCHSFCLVCVPLGRDCKPLLDERGKALKYYERETNLRRTSGMCV